MKRGKGTESFTDILRVLGDDFDRRVIEDPEFSSRVPYGSHVVIQISLPAGASASHQERVEEFNRWVRELAQHTHEPERPFCYATCYLAPMPLLASEEFTTEAIEGAPPEYEIEAVPA